jgi:hypothetical protein
MASILSVGSDAPLTQTRAAVLASALESSVVVAEPSEALHLLRDNHFDLVVLCHTVSSEQAGILIQVARNQSPPAKILIVDPLFSGSFATTSSGERLGPSADPAVLVAQARQLLGVGSGHPGKTTRPLTLLSQPPGRKSDSKHA